MSLARLRDFFIDMTDIVRDDVLESTLLDDIGPPMMRLRESDDWLAA